MIMHISALQAGRNLHSMHLGPLARCEFKMNPLMSTIVRLQAMCNKQESSSKNEVSREGKYLTPRVQTTKTPTPSTDIVDLKKQLTTLNSTLANFQSNFPSTIVDTINCAMNLQRSHPRSNEVNPTHDNDDQNFINFS